jgi:hypothetical protein
VRACGASRQLTAAPRRSNRLPVLARQRSRTKLSLGSVEKLGWIGNGDEIETLWRGGWTGGAVIHALEQHLHIVDWSPAEADINQSSYQHPHHMVKKAIGFDVEADAAALGTKLPLGPGYTAAMVGLVSLSGKGAEIVLAHNRTGPSLHDLDIEGAPESPLEATAEGRRGSIIGSDVVAITAGER